MKWRLLPKPAFQGKNNNVDRLLTALRFLTVFPVPGKDRTGSVNIGKSQPFFPVVGIIIGLILIFANWLLRYILPVSVRVVLLTIMSTVINGSLHLDGFIDTCDGLAGHKTPEERLKIMKDPHVGAFGVAGGILLILLKYVSLSSQSVFILTRALLLSPVLSRWAMVYAIYAFPSARTEGLGKAFKDGATGSGFIIATVITLAAVAISGGPAGLIIFAGVLGIVYIFAGFLKTKFGGLNGDSYGAINEVAEVSVFILTSIMMRINLLNLFSFL